MLGSEDRGDGWHVGCALHGALFFFVPVKVSPSADMEMGERGVGQ